MASEQVVNAMTTLAEDRSDAHTRGWIATSAFDCLLLISAPLIGLGGSWIAVYAPHGTGIATLLAALVGYPHYLSTFVFFGGDDQRAYYLSRPAAFLGGPLVILISVALLRVNGVEFIVFAAIFLWNIWHVSLQSNGVVSLYRQLAGGGGEARSITQWAILSANAAMALWFADTLDPVARMTRILSPHALRFAAVACSIAAAALLLMLVVQLSRRAAPVTSGELLALASALLLFHPYLWVRNLEVATFGMLIGHFVQYLSLVWLIQARKFGRQTGGSLAQRALSAVSARPLMIVLTLLLSGLVLLLWGRTLARIGFQTANLVILNSLVLMHFYLDGLIWAFKRPRVRELLGPYVTIASHRIAA